MGKGLRFVQNDMRGCASFRMKGLRFVQNDMAGNSAKMAFRVRSVIPGTICHSECSEESNHLALGLPY